MDDGFVGGFTDDGKTGGGVEGDRRGFLAGVFGLDEEEDGEKCGGGGGRGQKDAISLGKDDDSDGFLN